MRTTGRIAILLVTAVILAVAGLQPVAYAISNLSPDPNDMRPSEDNMLYYAVSDTDDVHIDTVNVKAYFQNNGSHKINIQNADMCDVNSDSPTRQLDSEFGGLTVANGAKHTEYSIYDTNISNSTDKTEYIGSNLLARGYGYVRQGATSCGTLTLTIPANQLLKSPWNGYYVAWIQVTLVGNNGHPGGENVFRLMAQSNKAVIAPLGKQNKNQAGYELAGNGGSSQARKYFKNFAVPLAPDCTVTRPTWASITIYDSDNGTPINGREDFTIGVYDDTPGSRGYLKKSEYQSPSSGMSWVGNGWSPPSNSDQDASVGVWWQPGHRYRVMVTNLYVNNTLQMQLPYDSIYYVQSCQSRYDLTPTINLNGATAVDPGKNVKVTSTVNADGTSTSDPTKWQITQLIFDPGAKLPPTGAKSTNDEPAAAFPGWSSKDIAVKNDYRFLASGTSAPFNHNFKLPNNLPVGSTVCYVASVSRPTSQPDGPTWRHSDMKCLTQAKKPKVQVWGGDLRVHGLIDTSTTPSTGGNIYGSWVEYGVFATRTVTGLASGASLANGGSSVGDALTFANTPSDGNFGSIPPSTLAGQFSASGASTFSGGTLNGKNGTYRVPGGTHIAASTIGAGRSVVLISSGTITIDGDITYKDGPYNDISQIPQVVIVAKNINITNEAKNVDAWLLTTPDGAINTCSDRGRNGKLSIADCDNPLKINGAVVTDHLFMRRTGGSTDDDPGAPAEIFDLRADAYLWALARSSGTGQAQTVYSIDLPPRF